MIHLTTIAPEDLNEHDIMWLTRGCLGAKWRSFTAVDLVREALERKVSFFRVTGDADGMVAVSTEKDEMFIETLAGLGFVKYFGEIHDALAVLARSAGLKKIAGLVFREGLRHLYDTRTKGRPIATLYVEDLDVK